MARAQTKVFSSKRMKAFMAAVLLIVGASVQCRGADLDGFSIETNCNWNVGGGFRNFYRSASKEQALAKLGRLRQSGRPVSVRAFLGDKLRTVRIISFFATEPVAARRLVREVFSSAILEPGSQGGPALQGPMWSELTTIKVRALLEYENGRVGLCETDGTHLFFEDSDGTYWWHRWDAAFPRRSIEGGG